MYLSRYTLGRSVILCMCLALISKSLIAQTPLYIRASIETIYNNPKLKSTLGAPIILERYSPYIGNSKRKILLQSGMHGNEHLAPIFLEWISMRIKSNNSPLNELIVQRGYQIDIIKIVNPDGVRANTRNNANDVNLNRNFPILFGSANENFGSHASSEQEVKNIQSIMKQEKYSAAIDVHGYANMVFMPSDLRFRPDFQQFSQKQKSFYARFRNILLRIIDILPGNYSLQTPRSLNHGGSFEDWAYWENGTKAICLEIGKQKNAFQTYEEFLYSYLIQIDAEPARSNLQAAN